MKAPVAFCGDVFCVVVDFVVVGIRRSLRAGLGQCESLLGCIQGFIPAKFVARVCRKRKALRG